MLSLRFIDILYRQFSFFFRNRFGGFAVTSALILPIILISVGSAIDIAIAHKAQARAQSVADAAALNSAIFVRNFDRQPLSDAEGYVDNISYSARDIGYEFSNFVEGGSNGVNVILNYDDLKGEVQANVTGRVNTTFMQLFGHDDISFSANASARYPGAAMEEANQGTPTSILMVLDNSGSMGFDDQIIQPGFTRSPPGAQPRLTGLRQTMTEFRSFIAENVDLQAPFGERVLRMGLLTYSSSIRNSIAMNWGLLAQSHIDNMFAQGGTESVAPMNRAAIWMLSEAGFHQNETGSADPQRVVIFMTDGNNNNTTSDAWTLFLCDFMKERGVTIYTIGFSLEVGNYETNQFWPRTDFISLGERDRAFNLLQGCATSEETFLQAQDTAALQDVFEQIGREVFEDNIRISN